jgi:hypothetical protein
MWENLGDPDIKIAEILWDVSYPLYCKVSF